MSNSRSRLIAIGSVLLVALLAVNVFLLLNKLAKDKELQQKEKELVEVERVKVELEKEYYEAMNSLEEMRGSNEELNKLIDVQKSELQQQKTNISRYITQSRKDKEELSNARVQIQNLVATSQSYYAQIEQLKQEKDKLALDNQAMKAAEVILQKEITEERYRTQSLESEKEVLMEERAVLVSEKNELGRKVNIASVIAVTDIEIDGMKRRSSGKLVSKKSASKIDLIRVCFNTTVNNVSDTGSEEFIIRILDPSGQTLYVNGTGSGMTSKSSDNSDMKFTTATSLDYNHDVVNTCLNWGTEMDFPKGEYLVEIFNKGYLAGQEKLKLN